MRTPEKIAGQLSGNYANYIKQKRMEDVGHFLQNYVVDGGGVTQDPTYNNRIVAEEIVVSLNGDVMRRDGQWFMTFFPSSIWYLDFGKDGDWHWSTSHPSGTAGTDYLTIATVTTNGLGNVATITDTRGHVGGFLLKDEYGLENYATVAQLADIANLVVYVTDARFGAVGDGVFNSNAAIQSALDYVQSQGGGTVAIPSSGTFLFTDLTVKSNTRFISYGGVLKLKDGTCTDINTAYYTLQNNGDNVTFDGLVIDGNKANNSSFTVADALTAKGSNVVVKNCYIYDAPDSAIMFSDIVNGSCINNRLDNGNDVGIYVNDGGTMSNYENVISGNRITNFKSSGIALKRMCQRVIVSDNTIYNCGNGITLENASTSSDYSKNISITNNRIRHIGYILGSAARAINLRQSDYTSVAENRIEDCKGIGIYMEGSSFCTITDNIITCESTADPASNNGIQLIHRDSVGCSYNVIKGNIVVNPLFRGIWLGGSVTSSYNQIEGNVVKNAGNRAMRVDPVFIFNTIASNTLDGLIDLEYYAGAVNNKLLNNTFVNNNVVGGVDWANQVIYLNLKDKRVTVGTIIPTSGTWAVGDVLYNPVPAAGGKTGWVCVTAGTPGVWKAFGAIDA